MSKRPELPEHVNDAEKRKERGELNIDLRSLAKKQQVIGAGSPSEVASRTRGVDKTWAKDLETGRNVQIVVRNGQLVVEEA